MKSYATIGLFCATIGLISTIMLFGLCYADTASYYTAKSCQKEGTSGVYTASGERYNENALTCAMRRRDFGGFYRITCLDTGKAVIVRQNDFGPNKKLWDKGRKVDLSKAAFAALAPLSRGVITVKIEKLK